MNVRNAVVQILRDTDTPLQVKEITERIIAEGLWNAKGKTPEATVGARIYSDIKEHGEQSQFVKVAPGTFRLRETPPRLCCRHREMPSECRSEPLGLYGAPPEGQALPFLQAAEAVIGFLADGQPMHYGDITSHAIDRGWLHTSGKTPAATMNAQLVKDIKRAQSAGEPGRFLRSSPGCYGLVKWQKTGLEGRITAHNQKVREQLLAGLMELTPVEFEEFVGQLLVEMGFEDIEVSNYSGDGGIDVRGTLLIDGVIRIKMAVQAKRWKKNIQSPVVQQVRGSLGAHEQGLIITTSNFSSGAIKEAMQADKTPVGLMNGEELVTLLMKYNIGVRRMPYDLFELDQLPMADSSVHRMMENKLQERR